MARLTGRLGVGSIFIARGRRFRANARPGLSVAARLRKAAILLNIRSAAPIKSKRIRKVEQVSANRYHNELLIASPSEVDAEVVGWLKEAHALSIG